MLTYKGQKYTPVVYSAPPASVWLVSCTHLKDKCLQSDSFQVSSQSSLHKQHLLLKPMAYLAYFMQ